jgi:sulfatase maturation enzyme AslB (radical SAM superfamily)
MGLDPKVYKVDPLLTVTRASLPHWKEIVDAYVAIGCHTIALRPMDPFGWGGAVPVRDRMAYTPEEFLHEFYFPALDYLIELNRQGVEILEANAATMLQKILTARDPNYVDLRSPWGSALGQLAYMFDGGIYTSDEGRMLGRTGDDAFRIGDVTTSTWRDVMEHEVVRACALASTLDGLPDCEHCAYKPWCGSWPELNYVEQGSVWAQMRTSQHCRRAKPTFDYLMRRLDEGGEELRAIFDRWIIVKPREMFSIR